MKLRTTMCCIAFFETRTIDLDPEELGDHSFAVCHANFLFVGSRLLRDPINEIPHHFIGRIIGNVGKPSLPFLVTPPDPMVQDYNPSLWHLIAHAKFDGWRRTASKERLSISPSPDMMSLCTSANGVFAISLPDCSKLPSRRMTDK